MTTSRVPDLIDALVAALQASGGLTGVKVVDGPVVTDSAAEEWVFVGYDGDPEGDFTAATAQQEWAGLGAKKKNEDITVTCAVLVQRGSTDVRACRVRTYEVLAAVESVLRADPSLGFPTPTVCAVTEHAFHPEQTPDGIQGRLPFTVTCTTRI
ncbi:hypothetical protein EDD90_7392 [Streptomyces sp. Ag109_O5-1]|uniref:hypothetical protein n=1 Tax=Streptomyces sp. Ag109_O5-1 TaxID=1938851 RepID=UPI000F509418|nr:hypothetical protein [Streptomyces sp. Ag109_O5-1]RPE44162.1 hypothetical protein EDD90_7392 [Streptomyces sp. Ag109_O5-1]